MRFLARRGAARHAPPRSMGVVVLTLFAAGCAKADPSVAAYVGTLQDHPAAGGRRR